MVSSGLTVEVSICSSGMQCKKLLLFLDEEITGVLTKWVPHLIEARGK